MFFVLWRNKILLTGSIYLSFGQRLAISGARDVLMLLFQTTAIENRITDSCPLSLFFEKNGVSSVCSQRQLNMLTSAEALPFGGYLSVLGDAPRSTNSSLVHGPLP